MRASVVRGYSGRYGLPHRPSAGGRELLAGTPQVLDFLHHERTQLAVRFFLGIGVTDTAPGEQVGTVAYVLTVRFLPPNELEILILRFHLLTSRIAVRTWFS